MGTEQETPDSVTPGERMVVAAAAEIRDGELVFVGMRLPLIAFALAKNTHAPNATGLFEVGVLRDAPSPELLYTMSDPANIANASWCGETSEVMALLAQGAVDLGFLGAAEVDVFGNLNTSYIGDFHHPSVRLPGSGGGADIASLSGRYVSLMQHEPRRLRERVDYVTSPGHGDGPGWRERVGLPSGGPAALVTTKGVFGFDAKTCRAQLRSWFAHSDTTDIAASTGWKIERTTDCAVAPEPTGEQLRIIRQYDPLGFWTR